MKGGLGRALGVIVQCRWLPVVVALGLLAASALLYRALIQEDARALERASQQALEVQRHELRSRIETGIRSIERLARERSGGEAERSEWEFQARADLALLPEYQLVAWLEPGSTDTWLVAQPAREANELERLVADLRSRVLELAREPVTRMEVRCLDVAGTGRTLVACAALHPESTSAGTTLAVFDVQPLMDEVVALGLAPGFSIALLEGDRELYRRRPPPPRELARYVSQVTIEHHGQRWGLRVWPTVEYAAQARSVVPRRALIAAALLSLLAALSVAGWQRASAGERVAAAALASQNASETRYRAVVEDQTEFIVRWAPDGRRTFVNDAYCQYFGLKREEALNQPFWPLIHEHDRERIRAQIASLSPTAPVRMEEHRVLRPDGSIAWNEWIDRAIFDARSQLVEYQSVGRDVSEQKAAQARAAEHHEKLRILTAELTLAEERERRRLAAELHDRIIQTLGLVKLRLDALLRTTAEPQRAALLETQDLLEHAIEETRSLLFELSPPVLYELGFGAAVDWLCERLEEQTGLEVELERRDRDEALDENVRVVLFQAVRELLQNIAKHAGARRVRVSLGSEEREARIVVEDDGVGLDLRKLERLPGAAGGFGLFSIRERLGLLGGRVEIEPAPGGGTRIVLSAPLAPAEVRP